MRAGDVRPRGQCWWCGDEFALRSDGTIRRHRDKAATRQDSYFCKGSLRVPGGPPDSAIPPGQPQPRSES